MFITATSTLQAGGPESDLHCLNIPGPDPGNLPKQRLWRGRLGTVSGLHQGTLGVSSRPSSAQRVKENC